MDTLEISKQARIDQLTKELQSLNDKLVVKETKPKKGRTTASINTSDASADIMETLLTLNKTAIAVKKYLDGGDAEMFKSLLTDDQLKKFVPSRYNTAFKSVSTVVKCLTPSQYLKFKVNGNKVTPTAYLNAMKRVCTLSDKAYNKATKLTKGQGHYSIKTN